MMAGKAVRFRPFLPEWRHSHPPKNFQQSKRPRAGYRPVGLASNYGFGVRVLCVYLVGPLDFS